jgi:hypothetical protein
MKRLVYAAVLVLSLPAFLPGQVPSTGTDSVMVVPGPQYEAGGWWRFWWGDHYRDAWTTPIRAEVLDCSQFTGGTVPEGATGGRQTRTLRLSGTDGRLYYFRSLDKSPSEVLPPVLRTSFAMDVLRDQISSQFPLAEMVVSPLADAAGVPHPDPRLVVFADEPGLGEFRDTFRGLPGLIEESADEHMTDLQPMGRPRAVVGSGTLLEHLQGSGADRVDSRALLTARLLDFYVGDWDRHANQWRWAAYDDGEGHAWYPIPLDRDQAFSRLDGVFPGLAQSMAPQFTGFGDGMHPLSLHWNARWLDRRFLADLPRPVFDSTATALAGAFSDDVLDRALKRLPPGHYALDADRIGGHLKVRRGKLPEAADRFYLLMAREVDVHATNEAEAVTVSRTGDRSVQVTVAARGADVEPWFVRIFHADETREVRVYLNGGDDRVMVTGEGTLPIRVRLIGGGGSDEVHFETNTGGVRLYDVTGDMRVTGGRSQGVSAKHWDDPPEIPDPTQHPRRDWGRATMPKIALGASSDYGFMAGFGMNWFDYGFRKDPYASKVGLFGALSTELQYELSVNGDFRFENSRAYVMGRARASSFDVMNFFGFGNDSPELSNSAARVHLTRSSLELAAGSFPGTSTSLAIGPVVSFSRTEDDPARFINQLPSLYGRDDTWQAGGFARFDWDSRRNIQVMWTGEIPRLTGAAFTAQGRYYPAWLDLVEPYGWLEGELKGYLQIPIFRDATHGAARLGGRKVWGTTPWYDAAFIGGPGSLRGWLVDRFAGDASAYGSAELRLHLLDGHLLMPSMWGILGFADVGRVWVDGSSPGSAHWGFGGGLWWGLLGTKNILSLEAGAGEEGTTFYFEWAFAF